MKPWQIIIIVLVILLLFGAPKLPGLAKSIGQSMRIFRKEVKGMEEDKAADAPAPQTPAVAPAVPQTDAITSSSQPTTGQQHNSPNA